MKNRIIYLTLSIFLLSAVSCKKDYLETAPTDSVDNSAVFTTTENADVALNGILRYMFERNGAQNRPGVGGILLNFEFLGEDLHISSSNWFSSEGSYIRHRSVTNSMLVYSYRQFYRMIGNANYIIDNIDNASGSDADKRRIKAEALTIRAYSHFYLVQMFGKRYDATTKPNTQLGVPILIQSLDTNKPRATVEEVYTQIVTDLEDAIALNVTTRFNQSHVNLNVAKGLRARVALVMQDYPNAIKFSKEVIDSNAFPLMSVAAYQTGFNDVTQISEMMWASMPIADQADQFGSFFSQIAFDANTSFQRGNPKRINSALYDLIPADDVRKKMWEPTPNSTNFPLPTTAFARQPYMSRKFAIKVKGAPTFGDVPLMRSSEMYLILAEAYAKTPGQETLAKTTLQTLNLRRNPSSVLSLNTGQALINEILVYRRVELWGEGFRFLDLKRLNLPLDRTAVPNLSATALAALSNTSFVPAGDERWQFLIPQDEIDANSAIDASQQNP
ncbi:RagB/SusD family nutrient uptake outer membrane protein [Pedobacter alpinus]|uniref:RagB/SusD family nutrient uptake outer membrane protein n=1 Tax=Pedobacter alpinus TaxID=1590643 RepID=A0ABW5TSV1_9SPHI